MRDDDAVAAAKSVRDYIGKDGVGRFCTGRYLPGHAKWLGSDVCKLTTLTFGTIGYQMPS